MTTLTAQISEHIARRAQWNTATRYTSYVVSHFEVTHNGVTFTALNLKQLAENIALHFNQ